VKLFESMTRWFSRCR